MNQKVKIAVIGLGKRGDAYGDYFLQYPEEGQVVYSCDINDERLEVFSRKHAIPDSNRITDADEMLELGIKV